MDVINNGTHGEAWYGNTRIKVDAKFTIEDESDFSHIWMTKV